MGTQVASVCSASDGKFLCGDTIFNNGYCKVHAHFKKLTTSDKINIMYCNECKQIKYWTTMHNTCTDCDKKVVMREDHKVIINDRKIIQPSYNNKLCVSNDKNITGSSSKVFTGINDVKMLLPSDDEKEEHEEESDIEPDSDVDNARKKMIYILSQTKVLENNVNTKKHTDDDVIKNNSK